MRLNTVRPFAVHMPDLTMDRHHTLWPACGVLGVYPYITSDPDAVTCQRARCQENARIARRLLGKRVDDMSSHERDMLRRLLTAEVQS